MAMAEFLPFPNFLNWEKKSVNKCVNFKKHSRKHVGLKMSKFIFIPVSNIYLIFNTASGIGGNLKFPKFFELRKNSANKYTNFNMLRRKRAILRISKFIFIPVANVCLIFNIANGNGGFFVISKIFWTEKKINE